MGKYWAVIYFHLKPNENDTLWKWPPLKFLDWTLLIRLDFLTHCSDFNLKQVIQISSFPFDAYWRMVRFDCILIRIFIFSALEQLLGQLGIYATWLSSIAYLQKQLCIFFYFLRHIFGSDYIRFLIEWSHCKCAYIFTLIACLSEYQTSGFYCTWSKSHRLLDISCLHPLCSFIFR